MIDHDAHRRILAWAVDSGYMLRAEYNALLAGIRESEWVSMQCAGKEKFAEFTFAQRIAQRSAGRHDRGMVAYRCCKCGSWHVGAKRPGAATRTQQPRGDAGE